jgi:polysaccharide biosynthesis protein PslH
MELLFLSVWFPFPQDNGSRIRVYHLLRALGERHRVHLAAFLPSKEERKYLSAANELCASVRVVERDPFWRDPQKRISAHLSLTPRDILRGYSSEMTQMVDKMTQSRHFDALIGSTIEAAPYALQVKSSLRVLEEHNFITRWMEERYRAQNKLLRRAAGWVTWQKCRRYERGLYPNFAGVSMVSERDLLAVRKTVPAYSGRLEVIPNGVDLETRRVGLAEPIPDTVVFNGALTYAANLEAMRFFISQAWPLLIKERPAASLKITGDTEGVDLSWLPDDPRIQLTGHLEDVRPAVAGSWLAIAPLRTGGGTRVKILEAMALGTPVVATSKGAEGLEVTPGKNILMADDAGGFTKQCLRLLEQPTLRMEIARQGRSLVEERYDWRAIGRRFCELVECVATGDQKDKRFG